MKETILVHINSKRVEIYRGMKVKHALISLDQALYEKALAGEILVKDENGFVLGLEGSLSDGAKIFTRKRNDLK